MHQDVFWPAEKRELYPLLEKQLIALAEGCPPVSALSNAAALIWDALPNINWAGFYLLKDNVLYLGPFQGKTACTMIPVGKGVCGTAAVEKRTVLVEDVHQFPGHIACDGASNSEIVVPIYKNGEVCGVLDIDSPYFSRFSDSDRRGLEEIVRILEKTVF